MPRAEAARMPGPLGRGETTSSPLIISPTTWSGRASRRSYRLGFFWLAFSMCGFPAVKARTLNIERILSKAWSDDESKIGVRLLRALASLLKAFRDLVICALGRRFRARQCGGHGRQAAA